MNIQTEQKLVKLTEVTEGLCKGTAEGMEGQNPNLFQSCATASWGRLELLCTLR